MVFLNLFLYQFTAYASWGIWIWLLSAFAGFICHSKQCALADYYRNVHMFFQKGADKCELDSSEEQYRKMKALKWSKDWFEKIYLFFLCSLYT